MNLVSHRSNLYLLLIGGVLGFAFILTRSAIFELQPVEFSFAIVLDLLITIPFLYYLTIKDRDIPNITVLPIAVLGLSLATFILPEDQQTHLNTIKWIAIPCLEIGLLGFVFVKGRAIHQSIQKNRFGKNIDFYDIILSSCLEVLPNRIARALATEIGVIYYAFFPLRIVGQQEYTFTYFKNNRIRTTIAAFLFIILIEATTIHLILNEDAPLVAWILAFLSLYTAIQVVAIIRSIPFRLIEVDYRNHLLILKYGFIAETRIPFSHISTLEFHTRTLPNNNSIVQFSPLGILDSHNLILHLNQEQVIDRMYGFTKRYQSLAIYIDDKEAFKRLLDSIIR